MWKKELKVFMEELKIQVLNHLPNYDYTTSFLKAYRKKLISPQQALKNVF